MEKFSNIESLQIDIKEGVSTITINNKKITPYENFGVYLYASEIEAVAVGDLAYLNPIVIEIDYDYVKQADVPHLETNVVTIKVLDKNLVEVSPIVQTPWDIDEKELHDQYQETLEALVKEDKRINSYVPVRIVYPTKEKRMYDLRKEKYNNPNSSGYAYLIGDIEFAFYAEVNTFNEALIISNRIIAQLDRKARAILKKK